MRFVNGCQYDYTLVGQNIRLFNRYENFPQLDLIFTKMTFSCVFLSQQSNWRVFKTESAVVTE